MQDQIRYPARRRVQRYKSHHILHRRKLYYMSVQKKHNFPTEGSYYKRFKFQVMQQSLKFGIVHDVSADVMLALA
jgi:hypothetical protein